VTATLWIDTDKEETIELGGTFHLYGAFAEMERVAGPKALTDWPSLFAVVPWVESQEDAPPDYLANLGREAREFFARYGDKLSDHPGWILQQLEGLGQ
jgi:hypothetical protein